MAPTDTSPIDESDRAARFNCAVKELEGVHKRIFWGDRLLTLDKSAAFLAEPAFAAAFGAVRGSHTYDQYEGPHTIAWRLHTLVWAAQHASCLPEGDFVECGVFKGDMAWVVATVLKDKLKDRKFYLYDSFAGLSPDLTKPEDYPDNPGFIELANRYYQQAGLFESVVARFADMPNVHVTRGFLPGALSGFCPDKIAFLHMDLNSPKAEIACLDRLFDRVVSGGTVVFDDYGWRAFRAQKDAEDAFFAKLDYAVLELPTGQGLVIKR